MTAPDTTHRMPVLYLSHGAPPLADDPVWTEQLAAWSRDLPRPKFIMKKELKWAPFIGLYALRIGSTPVARGERGKAMKAMVGSLSWVAAWMMPMTTPTTSPTTSI